MIFTQANHSFGTARSTNPHWAPTGMVSPNAMAPWNQHNLAEKGLRGGNFYRSRNFLSSFRVISLLEVSFVPRYDLFLPISKRERAIAVAC